jgi:EKC/KEOPS complex subunit CGI121/TPRKB
VLITTSSQIAESFRRFGISPTTTNLLVIKVSTPSAPLTGEQIQEHLTKVIEGTQIPFSDDELRQMTDLARMRKIYKLNNAGGGAKNAVNGVSSVNAVDESKELEILVLGCMALRGATN